MSKRSWAVIGLVVAAGCGSSGYYDYGFYDRYRHPTWTASYRSPAITNSQRPDLRLDDKTIEMRLAEEQRAAVERAQNLTAVFPERERSVVEVAAAVRTCYRQRGREQANALIDAHPSVYRWDEASEVVEIASTYRDGAIELTLDRVDGAVGPVAVAIQPGTYGIPSQPPMAGLGTPSELVDDPWEDNDWNTPESERRFRHWPKPQDLAFLRAPVVVIPAGTFQARVRIPVSCASFHKGAPASGTPYTLGTFEQGTAIDRLMLALCAGEEPPADTVAQLAVWLGRDDISWDQFTSEGGHTGRLVTFGANRRVLPRHADAASRLMIDAGVDPRALRFYGGQGVNAPATGGAATEAKPKAEEPRPEPEPTPEQPAAPTGPSA